MTTYTPDYVSPDDGFTPYGPTLGLTDKQVDAIRNGSYPASAEDLTRAYAFLDGFGMDLEGAAMGFVSMRGPDVEVGMYRQFPALAWDPSAATWREWQAGSGWKVKRSVLQEFTRVVGALCALEAFRVTNTRPAAMKKCPELRAKNLGPITDKGMRLAQVMLTVESWNQNPQILGLPDGDCLYVVSNKGVFVLTQELKDYTTRSLATAPGERSELWESFLRDLTDGDAAMVDGLQLWMGAALLPGNDEHKAHILFGGGSTGKSTFMRVIQAAFGSYAGTARASVFTSDRDNHPAERIPFMQYHLVLLPELPAGVLRSDLLKDISGGDTISYRGMRENPREGQPLATLVFSANELPALPSVDFAIKRRLLVWPMDNRADTPDTQLTAKLTSEDSLAAVVAWLQDGLTRYLQLVAAGEPLPIPERVQEATDAFFDSADTVDRWAEECLQEGALTQASVLHAHHVAWCEGRKRTPKSLRVVGSWLLRHYKRTEVNGRVFYPVSPKQ